MYVEEELLECNLKCMVVCIFVNIEGRECIKD